MTLRLGIDIGTSGVRTAVLDTADQVVSTARAPHRPQPPAAVDARLWWDAVADCLDAQARALADMGRTMADVRALAVDGTSGSMVLTDANLRPVSPALMYNSKGFDAQAARIAPLAPADHITQGANSALARAMHLVEMAEAAPTHLLHQADFIAAKLLGRGGLSDHNNALKTGFDPATLAWPDFMADLIDPKLLPDVVAVGTALGPVSAAMAARFGLSPSAQVHAGTTDSIAAFLACADIAPGAAVTSIGSTLAIKIVSPVRIDLPAQGLYSHRLGDMWLAGGASNTGGAVLAAHFSPEDLARLSRGIDPGKDSGLDFYPLLGPGERFPINDPNLAPRLTPRPASDAAFLHGLFDGIAAIEAQCYALIEAQGGPKPAPLFTAGGAAQNPTFTAIRARHLGTDITQARETEAAVGVAKLCPAAP